VQLYLNSEGPVKVKEIEPRDLVFCGALNEYYTWLRNSHALGR
jgi:hypothetical protein